MHFRSPIIRQGGEVSNKMLAWHFYANYDLKKYSYVTCRGEQSPSKFNTYYCQVKSMFSCEADLNTLTARQLKSTFGTKRLICCHACIVLNKYSGWKDISRTWLKSYIYRGVFLLLIMCLPLMLLNCCTFWFHSCWCLVCNWPYKFQTL